MATEIRFEHLTKRYGKNQPPVLRDIDFQIAPGELFFLLGPSGCGKSTLLNLTAGLLTPDSGAIYFNQQRVDKLPTEARNAAMVFQNYALWPHLSVFENVAFALQARKLPRETIQRKVMAALDAVQLSDFAARKVPALSGGQQQRVALARALAVEPHVLLLDEPLSNLDARLREIMRVELRRICKEHALTAIYVTHDRHEALSMGDRIAVLNEGVLQQIGAPRELYLHPVNRFVGAFLGEGNFFSGKVSGTDTVETIFGNWHTCTPLPRVGTQVKLMLRPEFCRLKTAGDATSNVSQDNVCNVRLRSSVYVGEVSQFTVCHEASGMTLNVTESAPPPRREGDYLTLHIAPEALCVLPQTTTAQTSKNVAGENVSC